MTWTIFKVFIEFLTILLLFHILVFWPRGMWDLSSRPGIEPVPPALEGEVLSTGPPRKSRRLGFDGILFRCTCGWDRRGRRLTICEGNLLSHMLLLQEGLRFGNLCSFNKSIRHSVKVSYMGKRKSTFMAMTTTLIKGQIH